MILIISGSARASSCNRGLANYIQSDLTNRGGEAVTFDISMNPLPIFTGEEENYQNKNVLKLTELANRATSFIICTPEYHNGMSGALKNSLDFLNKNHFLNKKVIIMAAGGSGKGGINALNNLRLVIRGLFGNVLPQQQIVDGQFFDEDKNLINESQQQLVSELINVLVKKECLCFKKQLAILKG